jgi:hypothetical protein
MILILPPDIFGFSGSGADEVKLRMVLTMGTIRAMGARGLTLEPLKSAFEAAGIGGMSRRLGYAAYHSVDFHKSFDMTTESCDPEVAKVPKMLAMVMQLVGGKLGLDFKPRYFLAMYLWAYGSGNEPETTKCRFIGAVYDVQENRLHSCTFRELVLVKEDLRSLKPVVPMPGEVCEALFGRD